MFAGHLPTKQFDLAEWSAMPVASDDTEVWPGDGFHRAHCRGRPIVFYVPPVDSGEVGFSVRPIVRVKMGRRVLTAHGAAFSEWWEKTFFPQRDAAKGMV